MYKPKFRKFPNNFAEDQEHQDYIEELEEFDFMLSLERDKIWDKYRFKFDKYRYTDQLSDSK